MITATEYDQNIYACDMRPRAFRIVLSLVFVSFVESFNLCTELHHVHRTSVLRSARGDPSSPSGYEVHLYSLKWSALDNPASFSKTVRETWRWKDEVLGDGRDFFVPRPKTLNALQEYIVRNAAETSGWNKADDWLLECVVLSNCARFEILLVTRERARPLAFLAGCFVAQIETFENLSFKKLGLSFDRPGNIGSLAKVEEADRQRVSELAGEQFWNHFEGAGDVCRHLCMIAAGMADRPSRPGRPVPFQPFSSRDAHVLLQLKRTLENAKSAPRIALLLRYALIAGKTVRNPNKISELQELRRYGTGNTKYDSSPPSHILEHVTQVCHNRIDFHLTNRI